MHVPHRTGHSAPTITLVQSPSDLVAQTLGSSGLHVGDCVGVCVGISVGSSVGLCVGTAVGPAVGTMHSPQSTGQASLYACPRGPRRSHSL